MKVLGIGAICLTLAVAAAHASDPPYVIENLGTLPNKGLSGAKGINSNGYVCGFSANSPSDFASFIWDMNTLVDLGSLGGTFTAAQGIGINAAGEIVGISKNAGGENLAFRWSNGSMRSLYTPTTALGKYSKGFDINNAGVMVGVIQTTYFDIHAAMWTDPGTLIDLDGRIGYNSSANAINNSGTIVGSMKFVDGDSTIDHAFLYDGVTITDLDGRSGYGSVASDINDSDQVVGNAQFFIGAGVQTRAALWDGGVLYDLGVMPGGTQSQAIAINNFGDVVGGGSKTGYAFRPFVIRDGVITDLHDLLPVGSGWTVLYEASDINDAGQIVGRGIHSGVERAFLLSPDCNSNGISDMEDMLGGTSYDCNGDYVPDECQPPACIKGDANEDGEVDALDIAPFVQAVLNGGYTCESDCISDCTLDADDAAEFVTILLSAP